MRVLIAAGGTGGHVLPALAIARELSHRDPKTEVLFVGTGKGIEASLIPQQGERLETLQVQGIHGKSLFRKAVSLSQIPRAMAQAWSVLTDFKPRVVVGMGGYVSGPVVLVAALRQIPTLIHEQNAYIGLTNRWLSRIADIVALSFPESFPLLKGKRIEVTGNPIRASLLKGNREDAREAMGIGREELAILVFGGSQGAQRINQAVVEALKDLKDLKGKLQFLHATGEKDFEWVKEAYCQQGFRAMVQPFFHDMASAYAASDFCICRAGATTIAEICALGKPALLVPYPHAASDHQRLNASILERKKGAEIIPDSSLDGNGLAGFIRSILSDQSRLDGMSRKLKSLGRPEAASRIVDLIYELATPSPALPL